MKIIINVPSKIKCQFDRLLAIYQLRAHFETLQLNTAYFLFSSSLEPFIKQSMSSNLRKMKSLVLLFFSLSGACDEILKAPTLQFESRFESGNLRKAIQVGIIPPLFAFRLPREQLV